jgi:seryl-tRNA synthetase
MSNIEGFCKHGAIARNCYSCHIEKTEVDKLYEKISELMVRVSKLEEYSRLQADHNNLQREINTVLNNSVKDLDEHRKRQMDENRAVFKHLTDLEESYQGLSAELRHLLQKPYFSFDPGMLDTTKVRFVSKIDIPKETLCMEKFTQQKTTGLTFEQAITAFKAGKKIRFHDGMTESSIYIPNIAHGYGFDYSDICRDHWEIVE